MAVQCYGAFMEKFLLQPSSPSDQLPLTGLTFAVKDMWDFSFYYLLFFIWFWKFMKDLVITACELCNIFSILDIVKGFQI